MDQDSISGNKKNDNKCDQSRRDFLSMTTHSVVAVGAACALWPMADSLNPASDTMALATVDVDITAIQPGQAMTVKWQGKPVFIKRRTLDELSEVRSTKMSELIDPQADTARVQKGKDEWLVVIGICTHLGCVPVGNNSDYVGGWFCPCHGSHYDASGRIRKGPAPKNLEIPPYEFVTDTKIRIG